MFSNRSVLLTVLGTLMICATGHPSLASDEPGLVVSAEWVHSRLAANDPTLVLLHVGRPKTFDKGHIPGAFAMTRMDFSDPDSHTPENLILELPDPEVFQQELRERGVNEDSRIVVYFSDDWLTATTRLIFTLDWAGLGAQTSLLDGGLHAWEAADFAVATDEPTATAGNVVVRPRDLVVDADWVQEHQDDEAYQLIDARASAFFDGVSEDSGAFGHIRGAGSLPWTSLIDEKTLKLHPHAELERLLAAAGVEPADVVVGYCHIGLYTTVDLLVARLLGHEVLLYDGAFQDWGGRRELPTVKAP